ncbi:hypothetical protein GS501_00180 [Saccharibacter sp. 17.LH.SD]|uniref:hypothetical protein n=1 Tax=Saccharibacter sp. 17.LH.SD TaxID=2689393 RepID=UPI00136B9C95|nr:hypothetical protein [Saccharibacter sp. 17.LH.SD]MXV43498.1 hypothetical protein [Saccharibacter sp. 17.LH.SD]
MHNLLQEQKERELGQMILGTHPDSNKLDKQIDVFRVIQDYGLRLKDILDALPRNLEWLQSFGVSDATTDLRFALGDFAGTIDEKVAPALKGFTEQEGSKTGLTLTRAKPDSDDFHNAYKAIMKTHADLISLEKKLYAKSYASKDEVEADALYQAATDCGAAVAATDPKDGMSNFHALFGPEEEPEQHDKEDAIHQANDVRRKMAYEDRAAV